jgi:deoxyribonuclease-4
MPILGTHQSIAGGYYRAAEIARQCGCDCVQLFTKNNNQWRAKELTDDDAVRFQTALREAKVLHPLSHDSYLINLGAGRSAVAKSLEAFIVELQQAGGWEFLRRHASARIGFPAGGRPANASPG